MYNISLIRIVTMNPPCITNISQQKKLIKKKRRGFHLGMMMHAYNHSTQVLRQEDCEFEANLGYVVRSCLKNK
jgi:hypothetical protein